MTVRYARCVIVDEVERYRVSWGELRRTSFACLGLLLGGIPLGLAVAGRAAHVPSLGPLFAAVWLIAFAYTAFRVGTWRCPRCRQHYFVNGLFQNVLGRRCRHCGLPKWSLDPKAA